MARRHGRGRRNEQAPGWVWMLFGLSLGLVVAFGVYLAGRTDTERLAASARPRPAPVEPAPAPSQEAPAEAAATARPPERRFDFYEILPEFQVVVPEVETAAPQRRRAPGQEAPAPKPVQEPGSYVLQAGSFSSVADADRMQASLALLGIESRIQRVTIDDAVFHRVRIGPISDLDQLNRIRAQLRDAHIEPLVMKAR